DWSRALSMLSQARNQGLELSTIAFNSAIDACDKGFQWTMALHLLGEMSQLQVPPSTSSFNTALHACGDCRRWQRLLDGSLALFDAMELHGCKRDLVSMNGAMAALVRAQMWAKALIIYEDISQSDYRPDGVTWTCLISALGAGQQWEGALNLFSRLASDRRPSIIICNAVLGALERAGCWEQALRFLRSMDRGANSVSYSATITACGRSSRWEWAVWLLAELRQKGRKHVEAGRRWAVAYHAAVQACRPRGRWEEALSVLGAMRLEGRGADRPTFTAVVSVLQADGRWRLSLGILEEMQESRLEADIATYREAIMTLEEDTHWSKALDMIDEVRAVRLHADQRTLSAAIEVRVAGPARGSVIVLGAGTDSVNGAYAASSPHESHSWVDEARGYYVLSPATAGTQVGLIDLYYNKDSGGWKISVDGHEHYHSDCLTDTCSTPAPTLAPSGPTSGSLGSVVSYAALGVVASGTL
ncbi:EMB2654, partial [Symbiodinium sp. CCMP2456]